MDFEFDLFHEILFLGLHPKRNHIKKDAFFKDQFLKINKEFYTFQPGYQLDFEEPLTAKRKYYTHLISNESIKILNTIVSHFKIAQTPNEKHYIFHTIIKKLSQLLYEIQAISLKDNYSYEKLQDGVEDSNLEDEIFIFQYLKTESIRIYLEITELFSEFATEDIFNEKQLYKHFFKQKQPSPSHLIGADKIIFEKDFKPLITKVENIVFKAIKADLRGSNKKVLPYDTIIKNPKYFAQFEEELYAQELIDHNFNFIHKQGNKMLMANVYNALIKKKYFQPKDFKAKKYITELNIKHFLNHRYKTNIDKEFRNIKNNPQLTTDFIANNFWIEKIPSC